MTRLLAVAFSLPGARAFADVDSSLDEIVTTTQQDASRQLAGHRHQQRRFRSGRSRMGGGMRGLGAVDDDQTTILVPGTSSSSSPSSNVAAASLRNHTAARPDELFRFALVTDTHWWRHEAAGRRAFSVASDASPTRDGLLVGRSVEVYGEVLRELRAFASLGGAFAVHAGDSVCGGASFRSPVAEYEAQLREAAAAERAAGFGAAWPIHHVPGNHDLHPQGGGLALWRRTFGNASGSAAGGSGAYRSFGHRGWRIVLLDFTDGQLHAPPADGHGHIGEAQLEWLDATLARSHRAEERVILIGHQLLVAPATAEGRLASWYQPPDDMVDNAERVLALLRRYPHVHLSLHGHVHANSLTTRGGVAFVSTSSAVEYPMQWREVIVRECEIELRSRQLRLPAVLDESVRRESRKWRNQAKSGDTADNLLTIRTCPPGHTTFRPAAYSVGELRS